MPKNPPFLRQIIGRDHGPAFRVRVIVLLYIVVACCWIFLGDSIGLNLASLREENGFVAEALTFVGVTAGMLYILILRLALRLNRIGESLRVSENKYRLLIENSPDAILIDRGGTIVFANPAAVDLFGVTHSLQLVGRPYLELVQPGPGEPDSLEDAPSLLARRKIVRFDGGVRDVEVASVAYVDIEGPCVKNILRDCSERQQKNREIRRLNGIYAILSQVNQALVRSHSREKLFAQVCSIISRNGGFCSAWVGWFDSQKNEVVPVAWQGANIDQNFRIKVGTRNEPSESIVAHTILKGRTCISNDYLSDPRTASMHAAAEACGCRAAVSLPIRRHRAVCGVLVVWAGEPNFFQHEEIKLLEEVAMDISFGLDRLADDELRRKAQEDLAKSEQHLRFLINHLHAGVIVFNPQNKATLLNAEITRFLGQPRGEILGRTPAELSVSFLAESGQTLSAEEFPSSRVIATGKPLQSCIIGIQRTPAAETLWLHANAFPEYDVDGALRQVIVTFVDISAHQQAIEAVRESEEKFRTLFSASRDAIILMEDNRYFDCNQAALEMFRAPSKGEFLKRKVGELSATRQPGGKYSVEILAQLEEQALASRLDSLQWMCRRFDGTDFIAEISLAPIIFRGRTVLQLVVRDISWRREAEQQLRQLSRVVEQSPASVVITDIFGNIQYVNPRFTEDTGYTSDEVIGENPRLLKSGEMSPSQYEELWKAISSGQEWRGEFHNRKKNGELFWQSASISPITNKAGAITQYLAIEEDITDRKRTEAALKESEEKFFKAFNTAPAIMVILTLDEGRCVEVNNAFVSASGYSRDEALGHTLLELGILEQNTARGIAAKLARKKELSSEECVAHRKSGENFIGLISTDFIEISGVECVIATVLDITERKQMEEKFLRVQRMESIGALAGGMAHDLNNILTPILMSSSLLREKSIPAAEHKRLITGIEEAAQRGANIVNQVLTFARGVKGRHTAIDAAELGCEVGKMVNEIFPKSITFESHLGESLWNIRGDPTQLQQVFLNLCVNSRDAMPNGGTLTLEVDNIEIDEAFAHMVPSASPGRYVQFSVKDTGTGMRREISDRAFEPFFTTKEKGKGTGLGLSTAVGIVRSHGGFMKVESELDKGSIFRVFVPATTSAVAKSLKSDQPLISRGNGETLLIVDDEPEILQIICSILEQNGWKTISASDGGEGVASFLMHSGEIQALLTDIVMPSMDGLGLIRSVRKLAPELPILVSSGFSNEESRGELEALGINGFLKKPFNARQLVACVVSVLYGKDTSSVESGK